MIFFSKLANSLVCWCETLIVIIRAGSLSRACSCMLSLCVCYDLYGPEQFIKPVFVRLFSVHQAASDFRHFCGSFRHFCGFPIPPKLRPKVSVSFSESFFKKVSFFSVQREKKYRPKPSQTSLFRFGRKKIPRFFCFMEKWPPEICLK